MSKNITSIDKSTARSDYEYGQMVGQWQNRRTTPELRPDSIYFWRGYLDNAGFLHWCTLRTTGRIWPRFCLKGHAYIQIAFQRFVSQWATAHGRDRTIQKLKVVSTKADCSEMFSGGVCQRLITALYIDLPQEPWMKTPDRIKSEVDKVRLWKSSDRIEVTEIPAWKFDHLSVAHILEDPGTMDYVRETYIGATEPPLIYEAGFRCAQGPGKHSASPERGALRACAEFCDPIAEAHKSNALFWRGWADRGFGYARNHPLGPLAIPMTLNCALALWEHFEDPQQFDETAAPGYATRTLMNPFIALRRLYIEPPFDPAICHSTPGHRRMLIERARKMMEQVAA